MPPRKANQPPARASTRTSKPSARKRAQSTSQPTQQSKKPKTQKSKAQTPVSSKPKNGSSSTTAPPKLSLQNEIEPVEIGDGERRLCEQQLRAEELGESLEEADEEYQEQEEVVEDDDAGEEEPKRKDASPLKFRTTWRAICGKEHLPGVRSGGYTKDTLHIFDIEQWKQEVLSDLQPRIFRVVSLVATASYERCRQADEFPQELRSTLDLDAVLGCLEEWHKQGSRRALALKVTLQLEEEKLTEPTQAQGRRTATQQQLNSLPQVLEAEERSGNHMPAIADHWACINTRCRNKGKTCWRSRVAGAPDIADDHYPVPSDLFRRWSKEVNDEISTVEKPSTQIILALSRFRDRGRKKQESSAKPDQQSVAAADASTTSALLNVFLVTQLRQLNQQNSPATLGSLPEHPAQLHSSPIRTEKDPQELLAEFFDWLTKQPGFTSERKIQLYARIKNTLAEEEWGLDNLREKRDGKGMTEEIWRRYGFKLGTLAEIRSRISDFKHQRPRSSSPYGSSSIASQ
jgi:hypothetical protein